MFHFSLHHVTVNLRISVHFDTCFWTLTETRDCSTTYLSTIVFCLDESYFVKTAWRELEDPDRIRCGTLVWPCCSSSPPAECSSTRSVSTCSRTDKPDTTPEAGARSAAADYHEDRDADRTATGTLWMPCGHTHTNTHRHSSLTPETTERNTNKAHKHAFMSRSVVLIAIACRPNVTQSTSFSRSRKSDENLSCSQKLFNIIVTLLLFPCRWWLLCCNTSDRALCGVNLCCSGLKIFVCTVN